MEDGSPVTFSPGILGEKTTATWMGLWITNASSESVNSTADYNGTTAAVERTVVEIVFIVLIAVVLMVLTVGGNLLVIIAYKTNRRLRSINNLFLVSLACSDLVIGAISMNIYPVVIITQKWSLGEAACDIWLCIDYTLSMASVANLMLICLDRYFSVTRPFTYRSKRTRFKAKIAIILAWIFSMLLWSPAIIIWPRVHERTVPEDECKIQFFDNQIITCVTAILAFYLPVIIMVILYWRIYMETRKCRQYMEYLRSYKVSHGGTKSPFIKRKVSARNSNPVSPKDFSDISPRPRVNSTPASSFRSDTGPVWRPDTLLENPHEPPCGTTIPYSKRGDCREDTCDIEASASQPLSAGSGHSAECTSINNNGEDKEPSSKPSHFKRLKRTFVDSIRNSLKSSASDCSAKDQLNPDGNSQRRDTASTLSVSRRSSAGTAKNACCTALLAEASTAADIAQPGARSSTVPTTHGVVVPIIVTTEDSSVSRPRGLARRTKSETDGLSTSASLAVPQSRESAPPRPEPAADTSAPGKIPASDRKAARTLSAILLAFVVTWLPYNVCVIYSSFCNTNTDNNTNTNTDNNTNTNTDTDNCIPKPMWDFAYYLCYINSTLNPICYAMCNKTFRNTFIRLLTCSGSRSQPRRARCCLAGGRRNRDHHTDTMTMQPSTSSSRSVPPSPLFKKRASSST